MSPASKAAAPVANKARALFAYAPLVDGDLALSEGDELRVTRRGDDGWWVGELLGRAAEMRGRTAVKKGRFPGNYVMLDDPADAQLHVEPASAEPHLGSEQVQEQEQEQE